MDVRKDADGNIVTTFIVARTMKEAEDWASGNLAPSMFCFVENVMTLSGHRGFRYVRLKSAGSRYDIEEIDALLKNGVEIKASKKSKK